MNKIRKSVLLGNPAIAQRAECVSQLIHSIKGEDSGRVGLEDTPVRVAKMFSELYWGYNEDPKEVLEDAMFDDIPADDVVMVKDIQFYSMCEHHMMPFFGKVHVAYIPKEGRVVGISKIARVVEIIARRLQVQERLGQQVAEAIIETLDPLGVAVIISAEHTCMTARGIQKPGTLTNTACMRGVFREDSKAREEVYSLLKI